MTNSKAQAYHTPHARRPRADAHVNLPPPFSSMPSLKQHFRNLTRKLSDRRASAELKDIQASFSGLNTKLQNLQTAQAQLQAALKQMGGLIPPPRHLQFRVTGEYYADFIEHGERLLGYIRSALASVQTELTSFGTVLDFGCGCARVLRAFHYEAAESQKLFGTDIDHEAIHWCRTNYSGAAEFDVNPIMPPMRYDNEMFDLIYSVSTFTHLPEEMQFCWLKELQRITRPGGYLVLTTHGTKYFDDVPTDLRATAIEKGFHYRVCGATSGLPDFYQVAYHTPQYIRSRWSEYFEILSVQERAIDDHQDIVVCRKC